MCFIAFGTIVNGIFIHFHFSLIMTPIEKKVYILLPYQINLLVTECLIMFIIILFPNKGNYNSSFMNICQFSPNLLPRKTQVMLKYNSNKKYPLLLLKFSTILLR